MNHYYPIGNNNGETGGQTNSSTAAGASTSSSNNNNNSNLTTSNNNNPTNSSAGSSGTLQIRPQNNIWETDALDNDDFDSDQLDEDSYSWASGITDNQDGLGGVGLSSNLNNGSNNCNNSTANWRDWRFNASSTLSNSNDFNNFNSILGRGASNIPVNIISIGNSSTNNSSKFNSKNTTNLIDLYNLNNQKEMAIENLVDMCAKYIAENIPYELVESYPQPVPEPVQLKIIKYSFPDNIENIRLYSCLANGNVDEYLRGEQLYLNKCIKKIIQIGFHLSAQVILSNTGVNNTNSNAGSSVNNSTRNNNPNNLAGFPGFSSSNQYASVSVVCDRKRIVTCNCSCSKQSVPWCSHVVAVCLYRIIEPKNVEYRVPVSETLSKLDRDQLRKFAQYLISELPQQILPTAQKLLDDLLRKNNEAPINTFNGAPDPTAGANKDDISKWCLDEFILQENIHKTLIKFIVPTPNVVSDVECLEHASSATAAEYTSLLRPLRGKEPEGMWNLISIIREMFRQRDKNSIPLLRIITQECLSIDQIVQLWFLVKSSQASNNNSHDKALFNSVSTYFIHLNGRSINNSSTNGSSSNTNSNLTSPIHQACASLMDEVINLWRIASLNPLLNDYNEKLMYKDQLLTWHANVFDKIRKFSTSVLNTSSSNNSWGASPSNSSNSTNIEKLLKRLDIDSFSGFLPAINACEMTWTEFEFQSSNLFKQQFYNILSSIQNKTNNTNPNNNNNNIEINQKDYKNTTSINSSVSNSKLTSVSISLSSSSSSSSQQDELNNLYNFEYDPSRLKKVEQQSTSKEDEIFKLKLKSSLDINNLNKEDPLEILFSRCESLYAHGFTEQACILSQLLANYMLENTNQTGIFNVDVNSLNFEKQNSYDSSTTKNMKQTSNLIRQNKCLNNFHNTVLWRSYLLCNILNETSTQLLNSNDSNMELEKSNLNRLAFQIGLFGLETPRLPAISKALEVKLINQEQELVYLLKKLRIGSFELNLLRDRAVKLRDIGSQFVRQQRNKNNYYSLPIMLASFIFDVLHNYGSTCNVDSNITEDQQLAFESSVAVLDMKVNISESQHSLLCEGIRRQKGDLALNLLLNYKDDEQRLLKIMDKILDREIHFLFKPTSSLLSFNPFNPNLKKIQQQQLIEFNQLGLNQSEDGENVDKQQDQPKQDNLLLSVPTTKRSQFSTAIDSLSSGWEESENESPNVSNEISLLETKYKCLSMRNNNSSAEQVEISQPNNNENNEIRSARAAGTSSDNSPTTLTRKQPNSNPILPTQTITKKNKTIDDSGDDSAESSSSTDNPTNNQLNKTEKTILSEQCTITKENKIQENLLDNSLCANQPLIQNNLNSSTAIQNKINSNCFQLLQKTHQKQQHVQHQQLNSKFNYMCLLSQLNNNRQISHPPSEALAHFMFEFSKTVLSKAGGSVSASMFLTHQTHQPAGPHRNLHICSFLISLYALGLQNSVQSNWLGRTYSNIVTWVSSQVADIGFPSICILIECWQGHFTPSECVSIADRASRGRDNMAVKAAAELALSSLRYSHLMNLNEIQRALIQCKEQNSDMLQRGCIIVENSLKDSNMSNLLEILFTVSRRWGELFLESFNQLQQQQQQQQIDPNISSHPSSASSFNHFEQISKLNMTPLFLQTSSSNIHYPQQSSIINCPSATSFYPYFNQSSSPYLNTNPYLNNTINYQQILNFQQHFQMQNLIRHQQQFQPQPNSQSINIETLDPTSMNHLKSAFRVGMLALEALPRRVDGSHQIKYRQSPTYADDVKWLWEISIKLDSYLKNPNNSNNSLQQFCQTAATVIQNPFLIQEIAFDSANYLSRNNPTQFSMHLCSPILNVLVQRCLNLYFRCCMSKLHHLNQNEHEDFINMLITARNIFFYSGNMNAFNDLLQNLRRSNKCKKAFWDKICAALNSHNHNM